VCVRVCKFHNLKRGYIPLFTASTANSILFFNIHYVNNKVNNKDEMVFAVLAVNNGTQSVNCDESHYVIRNAFRDVFS